MVPHTDRCQRCLRYRRPVNSFALSQLHVDEGLSSVDDLWTTLVSLSRLPMLMLSWLRPPGLDSGKSNRLAILTLRAKIGICNISGKLAVAFPSLSVFPLSLAYAIWFTPAFHDESWIALQLSDHIRSRNAPNQGIRSKSALLARCIRMPC
jgi:hypothetical protein